MVGALNLVGVIAGPAGAFPQPTFHWDIQSQAVAGETFSPTHGGYIPLGNEVNSSDVQFYWVDGSSTGTPHTATLSLTSQGVALTRTITANVYAPTVEMNPQIAGMDAITAGPPHGGENWNTALEFGVPIVGATAGASWSSTVTTPAPGKGQFGFLQLVSQDLHRISDTGVAQKAKANGQWLLDTDGASAIYGGDAFPINGGAMGTGSDNDSPANSLDGMSSYSRYFIAHTYTMYAPDGGIWVPLSVFQWSWTADLQKPSGGAWGFSLKGVGSGSAVMNPEMPSWTDNTGAHSGENEWISE